jgi:hypothetical protein
MTSNQVSGVQSSTHNGSNNFWQLTRASVDGLAKAIESGKTETLTNYLGVMARFHTYSARNALLIAAQRPDATHLEGIRSWNELGRFVRPGEKGIYILAPTVALKNQNQAQAKEEVSAQGKKAKGKKAPEPPKEPAQPERVLLGFRGVYVFDITQTGGEQLQESPKNVAVKETLERLTDFATAQGMTIEYADWLGEKKASSYRGVIRLQPGMKATESLPALLHEIASQILYGIQRRTFVTRALHQQETKAVAFVVCEALGLEAKTAFADCQLYYGDSRLLAESLEVVHRAAAKILGAFSPEGLAEFTQEVQ